MVFSSLLFLFRFLPVVLAIYYIAPKKFRNPVLFASSLFFYAWGEPVYVILILFSSVLDYVCGRLIEYCRTRGYNRRKLACLLLSVTVNLGLLGFFKYAGFFLRILHRLTGMAVLELSVALPIGISFYTFQTMSYTIDVYRDKTPVQKNFIDFGTYVSLFPQLIAGPIVRYRDIATQLRTRMESLEHFSAGITRFILGLGKKVLIANQIGALWKEIAAMNQGKLTVATAWLGVCAFTFQIYFDFSGYSDMALGLGKMFGFDFPENFDYPYISKSITEFWRRWHISLGTWFRDYVYIPLGGNRKGMKRQILNICVVWFLTGLWHGASVNFVLWGVYYGILLILEKILWKPLVEKLPAFFRHLYTMFFVMVGWSIFSWNDMKNWHVYTRAMFGIGDFPIANSQTMYLLSTNMVLLVIAVIGCSPLIKKLSSKVLPNHSVGREIAKMVYLVLIFTACMAFLINDSYNPFLYFRF